MQFTKFTAVSKVAGTDPRLLAVLRMGGEDTTVALVDLDKLLHERLDLGRRRRSRVLDDADAPTLDRTILVVHGKLATVKTPTTSGHVLGLDSGLLGAGTELDDGGRQNASLDLDRAATF
jgi:hypothetical protein